MKTSQAYGPGSFLARVAAAFAAAAVMTMMLPSGLIPDAHAVTSGTIYDEATDFGYIIDVTDNNFSAVICDFKPKDDTNIGTVVIPDKIGGPKNDKYIVTGIASEAFSRYSKKADIVSVNIAKSVRTIGDNAFRDCTGLKAVNFPNDLVKIGSYAFAGCTALTDVKLPAKTEEIGYSAFYNCKSVEKVDFPQTLKTIGQSAFAGCTSLEKAEMKDGIKSIGIAAFEGCSSLNTVVLPQKTLTAIEDYVFHNCTRLSMITIPDTIKSIGINAFGDCSSLTTITVPESVQSIGQMAFANCPNLTAVILPYALNNIGANAFFNSRAEIWGHVNSYAEEYAYRYGLIFHANGSVQKVTFSADNLYATVNNIAIRSSKGMLLIPPANVTKDEQLTISVTAPYDYEVNYITVNGNSFANGATYTVGNSDVNIFVSYRLKDATTTSSPEPTVTTYNSTSGPASTNSPATQASTSATASVTTRITDQEVEIPTNDDTTSATVDVVSKLDDTSDAKVRIITKGEYFIAPATIRVTNTDEAYNAAQKAANSLDMDNAMFYAFDISLYDKTTGKENPGLLARGSVTFQLPVPKDLIKYADKLKVYHIVDGNPQILRSSIVEDINGVKRVQFETDSFSPYMLIVDLDEEEVPIIDDEADTTRPANNDDNMVGLIEDSDSDDNNDNGSSQQNSAPDAQLVDDRTPTPSRTNYDGNINPHTGAIIAGSTIAAALLICIPLVKSNNKKRKRAKTRMS